MSELKKAILEQFYTLTEYAEKVGISRNHLSQIINGHKGLSFDVGCSMADALGISVDELRKLIKG